MSKRRFDFYKQHRYCPTCHSDEVDRTYNHVEVLNESEDFKDDTNVAWCNNCGWKGQVIEMVESNRAINLITEDL
jgi:hypothetical protein